MSALLGVHVAAGCLAILAGAIAIAARKGAPLHLRAGNWFAASMLVLGVTASILEPFRTPPGSPLSGVLVCYFIATGWMAARRRNATAGAFEIAAGVVALGFAAATVWGGLNGATTPAGPGPVFAIGALCALAGLLDLGTVLGRKLPPAARLSRHLWRMCFAFFIATGSFFLGQQKVMPEAVRGSAVLFVLAFAPFAAMAFWLVRVRLGTRFAGRG
jgi:Predicted membrane protein (DUF2306)